MKYTRENLFVGLIFQAYGELYRIEELNEYKAVILAFKNNHRFTHSYNNLLQSLNFGRSYIIMNTKKDLYEIY